MGPSALPLPATSVSTRFGFECGSRVPAQDRSQHGRDTLHLRLAQLGEHRQREATARQVFGDREIARPMTEVSVRRLERDQRRVVYAGGNSLVREVLLQTLAIDIRQQHDEEVPNVRLRPRGDGGKPQSGNIGQRAFSVP